MTVYMSTITEWMGPICTLIYIWLNINKEVVWECWGVSIHSVSEHARVPLHVILRTDPSFCQCSCAQVELYVKSRDGNLRQWRTGHSWVSTSSLSLWTPGSSAAPAQCPLSPPAFTPVPRGGGIKKREREKGPFLSRCLAYMSHSIHGGQEWTAKGWLHGTKIINSMVNTMIVQRCVRIKPMPSQLKA